MGTVDGRDVATDGSKLDNVEASADVTDAVNVASSIHGVAGKTTPVDADEVGLIDSAAANVLKVLTWANIKATLKTYFDSLYNNYSLETHAATHTNGTDDIQSATNAVKGLATAAQITKLDGIEAGATVYPDTGEQAFLDADHTKLDAIEAAADVTDATNVAAAGAVMDSDISPAEGFLRKTGSGAYTAIKSNLGAAVDPTVNEDSGDGYGIGSVWINTTLNKVFTCVDATVAAAVWNTSGSSDGNAIHDNVAGEIAALTEKTTPVDNDLVIIEDSAAANVKKKVKMSNIISPVADYVKVSDVKAYNVAGGTFTLGAWRTRDINTEDSDASGICSISSNQITLEAGTYICSIKSPAYNVAYVTPRLYNISDSAVEIVGIRSYVGVHENLLTIVGKFTIASQKIFEVQAYSSGTQTTNGFGNYSNIDAGTSSIYTIAEFFRVAT